MSQFPLFNITRQTLEIEWQQCEDEGRIMNLHEREFRQLCAHDLNDPARQRKAEDFLDRTIQMPIRENFPYNEPSSLEEIRRQRGEAPALPPLKITDAELADKIEGAWLGRACGCLLGKPVEGWHRSRMHGYLKETKRFPLADYFSQKAAEPIRKKYEIDNEKPFIENVRIMPHDDDMDYTVAALEIIKKHGQDFSPEDVAKFWLENFAPLRLWTAERAAFRNFCMDVPPPQSAVFRNPWREWIGAQIRADLYGYVAPAQPERAAEFAWRDACISHVKNGIYGSMWVAAMISSAFAASDIPFIIRAGLAQIPAQNRLRDAISQVLKWREENVSYDEASERLHRLWDEKRAYDWCHVISNAMAVAIGLLWGEGDFERSICRAVQVCFDTDCNGATVGSIAGVIIGAKKIPYKWSKPLNDTLESSIACRGRLAISGLAKETLEAIEKIHK